MERKKVEKKRGGEVERGDSQAELRFWTRRTSSRRQSAGAGPERTAHAKPYRDPRLTPGCVQQRTIRSHWSCTCVNTISLTTANHQHFCISLKNY